MSMDFPTSPVNGQTTTDGRYYFDSSVGSSGAWRSTPLPVGGLPAGSIMAWGTNTPPANWLLADGSAVSRSVYSSLFAVIGTQYGAGNGTTTFNLPDLRGRVPVGRSGGTFSTLGSTGGVESNTLTVNQLPLESVVYAGGSTFFTPISTGFSNNAYIAKVHSTGLNSQTAQTNLQPYQVVNYIIKFSAGWTAGDSELATRVGALETADATTNRSGLVPVVPASIAVASGSGSVSSAGVISFSGASSLDINNAFPTTYNRYRMTYSVRIDGSPATAMGSFMRLKTGSTVYSTAYNGGNVYFNGNINHYYSGIQTAWSLGNFYPSPALSTHGISDITVNSTYCTMTYNAVLYAYDAPGYGGGKVSSFASRPDGFAISLPAGYTMSGEIRVYGYR